MKKFKWIMLTILVVIIVVAGIFVFKEYDLVHTKTVNASETSLLKDNLVELSEWTTLKYEYSNVIISRDDDKKVPLPVIPDINYGETKLIKYSGYLKAGTDLSKIQISFDVVSKKLLIKIPKSKILDNVAETESAEVKDVEDNLFSDYPPQLVFDEINVAKEKLEEEKISQGFLDEADQRVSQLLKSFFKAKGYEDIEIEFF